MELAPEAQSARPAAKQVECIPRLRLIGLVPSVGGRSSFCVQPPPVSISAPGLGNAWDIEVRQGLQHSPLETHPNSTCTLAITSAT
jgi:hypothetical protein